ncbi:MAG: type III pantothenate kinase [Clostridiales bacterium]|nr:type III pantothenate kinase [Clostridiales bacterium]
MIIVVEADNTNIEIGVFDDRRLIYCGKISASLQKTADEFGTIILELFNMKDISIKNISGGIISSVVPNMSTQLKRAVDNLFSVNSILVSPGVKTGLNIRLDDPADLGSDMVCACVSAKKEYKLPLIIIDLSTATKIYAVDKKGAMIGGIISSGVKISSDALSSKTAALPHISTDRAINVIGKNTVEAMRSGVLYGTAGMIEGIVQRFEEELNMKCTKLITGDYADLIIPYCNVKMIKDKYLKLKGLNYIYNLNKR